jgi:predicted site-specific integrase-resolvase
MAEKSDFDSMIDEAQLAKRWGKSISTIRKYRNAGKVAFVSVNGRVKFRMTEVLRYEASDGKPKQWLNNGH